MFKRLRSNSIRAIAIYRTPYDGTRKSTSTQLRLTRVAMAAFPLLFNYGLPLILLNIPVWLSQRILQLMIVIIFPLHVFKYFKRQSYPFHYTLMLGFLAYMTFVSAVYNFAITSNSIITWLPGINVFLPLILFAFYDYFNITIKEIAVGFIVTAVFCAILALVDQVSNIESLDSFVRASTFDQYLRRLVLAKTEQVFAIILILAFFLRTSSMLVRLLLVPCGLVVLYAIVIINESRLALAATFLGCFIYTAFLLKSRFKIMILIVLILMVVAAAPWALMKYLVVLDNLDLISTDASVQFRNLEKTFFETHFNTTHGLGFGYMFISEKLNNFQSFAIFQAGTLFGAVDYPISLGDIGLWGALYQFGYIGLLTVMVLTGIMVLDLVRAGRDQSNPNQYLFGAFGATVTAFLISPLPMNYFTLDWTVTFGGTLWYVTARSQELRRGRRLPPPRSKPVHVSPVRRGI